MKRAIATAAGLLLNFLAVLLASAEHTALSTASEDLGGPLIPAFV